MRALSLFTGIGTHDLGLQWAGMTIAGQCEIEVFCRNVLRRHWPHVPRWRDVCDVNRATIIERCGRLPDLITGGFPCQQISACNNHDRHGIGSRSRPTQRSGLVWQMLRIIEECQPRWVLVENVPLIRVKGVDRVLLSLERAGYSCWPLVVGAADVGAPHRRKRVWIVGCKLADADGQSLNRGSPDGFVAGRETLADSPPDAARETRTDPLAGPPLCSPARWPSGQGELQYEFEAPRLLEPEMGGAVDGCANRLALAALGNSNPPQIVCAIGRAIMRVNSSFR